VILPPWERLLWSGRPWRPRRWFAGERYLLTDFRLIRSVRGSIDEIALDDIRDIQCQETPLDRVLGTSTIVVDSLVLTSVRRGAQLAALIEILASDPRAPRDRATARATLDWEPRVSTLIREASVRLGLFFLVFVGVFGVVIGLHGRTAAINYAADDAIAPGGEKRSREEIVRFMERDVMPWAREAFGRLEGGVDRVTCATCHGPRAEAIGWTMPAVAALPKPDLRDRGWETYTTSMDAQMRNAVYGYVAESDNQEKAAYMREIVVPGIARLLRRPAYDFTKPYEFNRSQHAIGCYHCHRVK
jgi:hypothetical protein